MVTPQILVTICWVVFALFWLFSAFSAKRYVRRGSWGFGVRIVIVLATLVLYQFPTVRAYVLQEGAGALGPIAQWIGVVLCAAGIAIAIWARVYLGRNWGMPMSLKQDAELVTSGPYAYVRHPIYSGVILAMLGTTLVIIWWLVPVVCFFFYFIWSARTEEKIMTKEFPGSYPDYMKRSKMLIPFVI